MDLMRPLRTISVLVAALGVLLGPLRAVQADEATAPAIKAYFAGYEQNDLVFKVTNEEIFNIEVKGISYRGQVLYHPLVKNHPVPSLTEKTPVVVKFRSNGDYVWSENHMKKFRMAYVIVGSPQRHYAEIFAEMPPINP